MRGRTNEPAKLIVHKIVSILTKEPTDCYGGFHAN